MARPGCRAVGVEYWIFTIASAELLEFNRDERYRINAKTPTACRVVNCGGQASVEREG
jgi:hypothetical protein